MYSHSNRVLREFINRLYFRLFILVNEIEE